MEKNGTIVAAQVDVNEQKIPLMQHVTIIWYSLFDDIQQKGGKETFTVSKDVVCQIQCSQIHNVIEAAHVS